MQKRRRRELWLSDDEAAQIDKLRGAMPRPDYIRAAALKAVPAQIPAINTETRAELAAIGNNLNQIAKTLNGGLAVELGEIQKELARLRLALLGVES